MANIKLSSSTLDSAALVYSFLNNTVTDREQAFAVLRIIETLLNLEFVKESPGGK